MARRSSRCPRLGWIEGSADAAGSQLDQLSAFRQGPGVIRLIIPITKGLLREQSTRRSVMFFVMLSALVLLFVGATFFDRWLREHRVLFVLYWFACAWTTLTSVLLALYDLLTIRAASRRERRRLANELLARKSTDENAH